MNDRDPLLAAITAEPDEDTPRLVYADWLTEHGEDERAEFIRVQCRLEHLSQHNTEGRRLASREKELREKLFGHLDAPERGTFAFRRGFLDTITCGVPQMSECADALTPEIAPAFALVVRDEDEDGEFDDYYLQEAETKELFAHPVMRRCVSLDLPCMGMDAGAHILRSPHLLNLRRLNYPENETGPVIQLVAAPTFANLRWACFRNSDSAADNPSIVPLAECPYLANLEHLDFGECEQGNEGAHAVAAAKHWNRLRFLSLSCSFFEPTAVVRLFHTAHLPALTELDLSYTFHPLGSTPVEAEEYVGVIAGSPLLARLSRLSLQRNDIDDDAAKALAAAPPEVKLARLDLRNNPIGVRGERALVKRFGPGVCLFGEEHP